MKTTMLFIIVVLGFVQSMAQSITNAAPLSLGRITTTNALMWDAPKDFTNQTVTSYSIFLAETNSTNFARIATTSTNRWPGTSSALISGWKKLYITALMSTGEETDPSDQVLIWFRSGVPAPIGNIRLYSLIQAAATNALPLVPQPPLP